MFGFAKQFKHITPEHVRLLNINHDTENYICMLPEVRFSSACEHFQNIKFKWIGNDDSEPCSPWKIYVGKGHNSNIPIYIRCRTSVATPKNISWIIQGNGEVEQIPYKLSGLGGYPMPHTIDIQLDTVYIDHIERSQNVVTVRATGTRHGTDHSRTGLSLFETLRHSLHHEQHTIVYGPRNGICAMPKLEKNHFLYRRTTSVLQWNDVYGDSNRRDLTPNEAETMGSLLHSASVMNNPVGDLANIPIAGPVTHAKERLNIWKFGSDAHALLDCYATGAYEEVCCPEENDVWYKWTSAQEIWEMGIGMDYAFESALKNSDGQSILEVLHLFPRGCGNMPVSKLQEGIYLLECIPVHQLRDTFRKPGSPKRTIVIWRSAETSLRTISAAHRMLTQLDEAQQLDQDRAHTEWSVRRETKNRVGWFMSPTIIETLRLQGHSWLELDIHPDSLREGMHRTAVQVLSKEALVRFQKDKKFMSLDVTIDGYKTFTMLRVVKQGGLDASELDQGLHMLL